MIDAILIYNQSDRRLYENKRSEMNNILEFVNGGKYVIFAKTGSLIYMQKAEELAIVYVHQSVLTKLSEMHARYCSEELSTSL